MLEYAEREHAIEAIDDRSVLLGEIEKLADSNEVRGLRMTIVIALVVALIPPIAALALGFDFSDKTVLFWTGALVFEAFLGFSAWCTVIVLLVPSREHLKKLVHAIDFATHNPIEVGLSQSGQEVRINMPEEVVILDGDEAKLFMKHWRGRTQ